MSNRKTSAPGNNGCLRNLIHAVSTVVQVDNLFCMVYLAEKIRLTGFVPFLTGLNLLHGRMEVSRTSFFFMFKPSVRIFRVSFARLSGGSDPFSKALTGMLKVRRAPHCLF